MSQVKSKTKLHHLKSLNTPYHNTRLSFAELNWLPNDDLKQTFNHEINQNRKLLKQLLHWLSYQSGHNYAFMLQLLRANMIPYEENDFFKLVNIYFPNLYDIRYIAANKFKNPLAAQLYFEKTTLESPEKNTADRMCQLISSSFFHLKAILLKFESYDPITFNGFIYGIGSAAVVAQPTPVHPLKQPKLVKQISLTKERHLAKSIDDLKLPAGIRIVKPTDNLEKVEIAVNA